MINIIIRSYKREGVLVKKTLGELYKHDLAGCRVFVVVADHEQSEIYRRALEGSSLSAEIIVGELGGHRAILSAIEKFEPGERLFFLDDDMSGLVEYTDISDRKSKKSSLKLGEILNKAFDLCEQKGVSSFTVDYSRNLLFKEGKPWFDIRPRKITMAAFGIFNDKTVEIPTSHCDDNYMTTHFLNKDGAIGQLNWLSANFDYGTLPGGMQSYGRGELGERLNRTLDYCNSALKSGASRYFTGPHLNEKANCYDLKIKAKPQLSKELPWVEHRVESYMGDFQGINSLFQ